MEDRISKLLHYCYEHVARKVAAIEDRLLDEMLIKSITIEM